MKTLLVLMLVASSLWAQTPDSTRADSTPVVTTTYRTTTRLYFTSVVSVPAPTPALTGIDTTIYGADSLRVAWWTTSKVVDSSHIVRLSSGARGVPFGPYAFWTSNTTVAWGPAPLTASIGANNPGGVVLQIGAARAMGQKLVLCLAGCAHTPVTTSGKFDLAKWKTLISAYNTTSIKTAIAAAVADGTVIGNSMMDEPEHSTWGGTPTKAMLDGMATYAKQFFPTLPMGFSTGPGGYRWRATERYQIVDFAINQYEWRAGPVQTWLTAVRAEYGPDGVTLGYSINSLAGGVQDRDGVWSCDGPGQAGKSLQEPWCRMTADSLRVGGRALAQAGGCALMMWRYEATYFGRADNQQALRDIAVTAATAPRRTCVRTSL